MSFAVLGEEPGTVPDGPVSLIRTRAHVHLDHIRANLEAVRDRVGSDRKILVAVKANAYGHGLVQVARMAAETGSADWLGVATLEEGRTLRACGVTLPILKFSPAFPEELPAAVEAGLTLAVCTEEDVRALQAQAAAREVSVKVHLKVDTGMARIGVAPALAPALARLIEESPSLELEGIFTHLPVADTAAEDEYTRGQLALFADVVCQVQETIGREVELVHAANSGGVLVHETSWLDMVRPGIMSYGHYPDASTRRTVPLRPGLTWMTRISFLKYVRGGTTVGYGRTWTAPYDTWIATIPVGYGDGYNRGLSSRGSVLISGRRYPIAGRVCMDQTMVDVGPDLSVAVGDDVVLLGRSGDEEITATEMADLLGTISYEITCAIGARVPRVYDDPAT